MSKKNSNQIGKRVFAWLKRTLLVEPKAATLANRSATPAIGKPTFYGLVVLATMFGGFALWSILAPLESAAVAPGRIIVDTNRKTVQHLEGGIIEKIFVKEGDMVESGDPLVLLDKTQAAAKLDSVQSEKLALQARIARLIAERDELSAINFPDNLLSQQSKPTVKKLLTGESAIFKARRESTANAVATIEQQISELQREINSLETEVKTFDQQLNFLKEETLSVEKLVKKEYASKTELLRLHRQFANINGERESNIAEIARARQKISDSELKIINLKNQNRNEVVQMLQETREKLSSVLEKEKSASHILTRTLIVAPKAGRIVDLQFHTKGGVIGAGEKILDIVPSKDPLTVEARINPLDIDIVRPGLVAKMQLTPYKTRHTPRLEGLVKYVSADSFQDQRTGQYYYLARIEISPRELELVKGLDLYPGMPVDVMIITDKRTPFKYFITPIKDSFSKAFREE